MPLVDGTVYDLIVGVEYSWATPTKLFFEFASEGTHTKTGRYMLTVKYQGGLSVVVDPLKVTDDSSQSLFMSKLWITPAMVEAIESNGYTFISGDDSILAKALRSKYNPSYTYNTASIATQTVDDVVLGSDGVYYKALEDGISGVDPVGDTTGKWEAIIGGNRKNYIYNGNFSSWQYAISTTANGYGSSDGWYNGHNGSTKTNSMVSCSAAEMDLLNAQYFSRTVVSSLAGASNYVYESQSIENIAILAGKTVAVSFFAKANENGKKIQPMVAQNFGTGGSPSDKTYNGVPLPIFTLTTDWEEYTFSYIIPTIESKTVGSDGLHTSSTQLYFVMDAGASWNLNATLGQQSGTFDLANICMEDGEVATGYNLYDGEFGSEKQVCQRYLPSFSGIGFVPAVGVCSATNKRLDLNHFFQTEARVPPTGYVISSLSHFNVTDGVSFNETVQSFTLITSSRLSVSYSVTSISDTVAGRPAVHLGQNDSAKLYFTGCEL